MKIVEFAKENAKKVLVVGGVVVAVVAVIIYAVTKNGAEEGSTDAGDVEVEFEAE